MAETADGKWAASTTGREMPRQNGKGDEVEVVELWGLVHRAEAILHTIHDAVVLASETQQRMSAVLDHPDLRRRVKRTWRGTGQQMIEMRNGGIIWYRTRTGGGGRGVADIDRLVIDEAQHATEEHLAAVAPTLLANANPQLNVMGTSGLHGRSSWWWRIRKRALSAEPGAFGYVGHTAEVVSLDVEGNVEQQPVDVTDRQLWWASNPVLHSGRGQGVEYFAEQLLRLGPESFAREHLCVWDPEPGADRGTVKMDPQKWALTATSELIDVAPGAITIGFDVARGGEWSSIGIASGSISDPYVEVVDHRLGVGWLPARLVELVERWQPTAVGCNGAGATPAQVGPVLVALTDAGQTTSIEQLSTSSFKAACGGFYADVVEGRLRRPAGQTPLDAAAANATERVLGDAWAWDLRTSEAPISPLVAVTVARSLLGSTPGTVRSAPMFATT